MAHRLDDISGAGLALGANHGRAFGDPPQSLAQVARAAHERNLVVALVDVMLFIGRCQHFALVDVVDFQRFQNARFHEMADARLGHHRNADLVHDLADLADGRHARHAAFLADIGGHALQRHDSGGAGFFGDDRLLGVGHVHDHAAFQHFGQADFQAEVVVEVHVFSLDHCGSFDERGMRAHALQFILKYTTEDGDAGSDLIRRHPGKADA